MFVSGNQMGIGNVAVAVFFVISGYLIVESFERTKSAGVFILSRALRLYPALIVTLLILSLVLGPIVTEQSVADYFSALPILDYFVMNLSFLQYSDPLPGVFARNPAAGAVDGSLWTLMYEVECYALGTLSR